MSTSIAADALRVSLTPPPLELDVLVLDHAARTLRGPAGEAALPGRVFRVAERLMREPGALVEREALLHALYGAGEVPGSAEVRLSDAIGGLRAAVAQTAGHVAVVRMSRGAGYALVVVRPATETQA